MLEHDQAARCCSRRFPAGEHDAGTTHQTAHGRKKIREDQDGAQQGRARPQGSRASREESEKEGRPEGCSPHSKEGGGKKDDSKKDDSKKDTGKKDAGKKNSGNETDSSARRQGGFRRRQLHGGAGVPARANRLRPAQPGQDTGHG
ncbi:MAG TPA: hypothetical protein VHX61_12345 [Rhizomicrobium sp.]|nr:hypothetical protein [Rhizomicrobium sp.]